MSVSGAVKEHQVGFSFSNHSDRVSSSLVSKVANVDGNDSKAVIKAVKDGLPIRSYNILRDHYGKVDKEMVAILAINPRTLSRRKKEKAFSPDESDKLVRFAKITDAAIDLFGDQAKALAWLDEPLAVLGGDSPLMHSNTEVGAREVEKLIGRLAYGVYS